MIEIRLHGRGGQGVVTAAELIAIAAFYEGQEAQAFPNFGVERRGAPIEAYARIDEKSIKLHSQIYEPDFLIIQDDTLLSAERTFRGVKKGAKVVVNSKKDFSEIKKYFPAFVLAKDVFIVPATETALQILGKLIVNMVMLGAFAYFSKLISLSAVKKALAEKFSGEILEKNIKAVTYIYEA